MGGIINFDIKNIYTFVHKHEGENFCFKNPSRQWDGFILVTSGEIIFKEHNKPSETVEKNSIIFLNKGDSYTVKSKKECSYFTSAYDFEVLSDAGEGCLPKICKCDLLQVKNIKEITDIWQRKLNDSFITCKIDILKFYLDFFKKYTAQNDHKKDGAVSLAVEYIHKNFKRNFCTDEIAEYCSISPSHLRLKFQKEMNMTITDYRDSLRIKTAKEMLSGNFFTVKETAYELGFCDVYYFTKFFKTKTGITPAKCFKNKNGA